MADHKFTIKIGESVADFHSRLITEYGCEECGEFTNNGCGNWLIDGYMFDGDDMGFYDCDEVGAGPLGCMKKEKGKTMNDNDIAELMRQLEELKKENAALKRDVKRAEDGGFISSRAKKQRERFELCDRFLEETVGAGKLDPEVMRLQPENIAGAMVLWAVENGIDIKSISNENAKHPWKGTTSRLTRTLGWKYGFKVGERGNTFVRVATAGSKGQ